MEHYVQTTVPENFQLAVVMNVPIIYLIVLSELPLTTNLSLYCKQAMPRLCPLNVRTNSHEDVFHTFIVLSPDADTMYFSSKSTTFTAARCPTSTRLNVISVCEVISHTAIERSYNKRDTNDKLNKKHTIKRAITYCNALPFVTNSGLFTKI